MESREELETKGISQLMAERFAKGVPRGVYSNNSFQKAPPTFWVDTEEASDMLQDKSGKGTHDRHSEYVKLKDVHDDIQNGAELGDAMRARIGDDPLMGHGKVAYKAEPADKLVVYGRKDKDVPIMDGGAMYGKEVGMGQVEDIRKRHAAKEAAMAEIDGAGNPLGAILTAAVKTPHMYVDENGYEEARQRAVKNAIGNQKAAQEVALANARKILVDAGYPEDMVDQMLGGM